MKREKKRRTVLYGSGRELLIVFVNLAGATLLGSLFWKLDFPETNIVLLYSFAIFLIARFCAHPIYGVLAAIAGTLIYNYFFTEPYFTLNVYDSTCLITFMTMTITSLLTSALVSSDQEHLAQNQAQGGASAGTVFADKRVEPGARRGADLGNRHADD